MRALFSDIAVTVTQERLKLPDMLLDLTEKLTRYIESDSIASDRSRGVGRPHFKETNCKKITKSTVFQAPTEYDPNRCEKKQTFKATSTSAIKTAKEVSRNTSANQNFTKGDMAVG
ncbi:hypothetical protein AYI69_g1389 [Smittium culicis]|uniref:Uncharacterized protein n=1 Tax=Smittium culicis TaxID=133412 RepID=A0A1R1YQE5_9FUNG|nr:hypothetical protein AYI69_g2542 [Smittium culicis]OMJ29108.1 hypothetical protein AYI69_g1389 [Smittium culicis]